MATGGVLLKKVLLKISQKPQENTCTGVSFLTKLLLLNIEKFIGSKKHLHINRYYPEGYNVSGDSLYNT